MTLQPETFQPGGDACPLCHGGALIPHRVRMHESNSAAEMPILECAACGFAWQWPLQRNIEESVAYFEAQYASGHDGSYFDKKKKEDICALEIGFLNSLIAVPGVVLDVGSGDGTFAEVAFRMGWSAYGLDPAGPEQEQQNEGRTLRLIKGTLPDLTAPAHFDVITLWDVIEHLERPAGLIAAIRERLRPGGWLVIETGNYQSVSRVREGKVWWCYHADHRWYFTPGSLRRVLEETGFTEFRLCPRTLRPWIREDGGFAGPRRRDYVRRWLKRPWTAAAVLSEYNQLRELARREPDTANLQIFALAARIAG